MIRKYKILTIIELCITGCPIILLYRSSNLDYGTHFMLKQLQKVSGRPVLPGQGPPPPPQMRQVRGSCQDVETGKNLKKKF